MANLNGLPILFIDIKDEPSDKTGWDVLSLVDYPAIESNWVAMSDKKAPLKFAFNADQKLLYGPALIPDLPIYRYDEKMGEYYVVFTKDVIQRIVRKRQKQGKNLSFNYQHQSEAKVEAIMQEIWLTGKSDKSKDFGFELPEGSAFVVTYIEDDKFWNEQVKTGNVKGYSIEGWLDMEMEKHIKKYKMENTTTFTEAKTNDGMTLKTTAEAWAEGVDAVIVDAEGKESPANGEYTLENGTKVTCTEGKVTTITEAAPAEDEMNDAEVAALSKVFSKVLKPLHDEIEAIKTKLSQMPGAPSATEHKKETPKQPTAKETALAKVEKVKAVFTKTKK